MSASNRKRESTDELAVPLNADREIENPYEEAFRVVEFQQGSRLCDEGIVWLKDGYERVKGAAS